MIWYLTTEELMEKYSKRSVEKLERTNYLIMSSFVRITTERDNVLNITTAFQNAGQLKGVGFDTEPDSILAKEQFKNFLLKNPKAMSLLCATIECALIEGEDTVIICTPNEMKCKYLEVFAEVVEDIFGYPILRYPEETTMDVEEVIKRLLHYKSSIKEYLLSQSNDMDRIKMLERMGKKEIKKELKKRGLYSKDMTKSEMVDILNEFY